VWCGVLVAFVVGIPTVLSLPWTNGPGKLAFLGGTTCVPLLPDQETLAAAPFTNRSGSTITLGHTKLLTPRGLTVTATSVADVHNTTSIGFGKLPVGPEHTDVWAERTAVDGRRVAAGETVDIVTTIALAPGASEASSSGMQLSYRVEGDPRMFVAVNEGTLLAQERCF